MKDSRQALPKGAIVVFLAVILGAALRFTGIGWGLQHPPHSDEQAYVESVNAMLDAGDLDHRYYYYPGLFFYLLAPILSLLGEGRRHGPEAYLACRIFVASVASFNVWLAAVVARSFGGPWAAAGAALSLAVFPLSTAVAHEVRPDLCLETLGLLILMLYSREIWEKREFVLAGVVAGLATAIKFSGLLFFVGIAVAALVRRAGFKRLFSASLLAAAIVVAATPYALVHPETYVGGRSELDVYFQGLTFEGLLRTSSGYARAALSFGGPLGALVAAFGFVTFGPSRKRTWLPWIVHFAITFTVFSLASIAFPRHLLQVTGGLCVLFGFGLAQVALSSRTAAAILVVVALALPFRTSLDAALVQARPSAPDRVKEWIDANMKDGAVILESRRDAAPGARAGSAVGVDRSRFEFLTPDDPVRAELRLLMPHVDLVIVDAERSVAGSLFAGSTVAYDALGPWGMRALSLVVPLFRVPLTLVQPDEASASAGSVAAVLDGDFQTRWSPVGPMNGTEWLEFRFKSPRRLCRVDLDLPTLAFDHEPEFALRLAGTGDSIPHDVHTASARPNHDDQVRFGRPRGEALVFEPETVIAIRIEQKGVRKDRLFISEVRLFECGTGEPTGPK